MSSLLDDLKKNLLSVSASEFDATKKLPPYNGSSWAVWGKTTFDLSIFDNAEAVVPRLRKDVVIMGANFGGTDNGSHLQMQPFQNFHTKGHGPDTKLRNAVTGTALEGVFLSDLVKNYPTQYANKLAKEIFEPDFDLGGKVIEPFEAEQEALGLTEDTLFILMGANTVKVWDALVEYGVISKKQRVFHKEYVYSPEGREHLLTMPQHSASVSLADKVSALLQHTR